MTCVLEPETNQRVHQCGLKAACPAHLAAAGQPSTRDNDLVKKYDNDLCWNTQCQTMYRYVFDKVLSDGTVIGIVLYLLCTQPAERTIWLTLPDVLEWPSATAVLNYSGDTNDAAFVWGCVVRDVPMVNLDATLCLLLSLPFYWISRTAECERNWWHTNMCVVMWVWTWGDHLQLLLC